MNGEVDRAICRLEQRIAENEVLSQILKNCQETALDTTMSQPGYSQEEIDIGRNLIELFLILKEQSQKAV